MTDTETRDYELHWDVYVTPGIPVVTNDLPPGMQQRLWSPRSATLIYGERDAVDLAQILHIPPRPDVNRLSAVEWTQVRERLKASGFSLQDATASEQKLTELRTTYEPFVRPLADLIQVSPPPLDPARGRAR